MESKFVFPSRASGYQLLYEVDHGSSYKVWRAHCVPLNQDISIKIIDLEKIVVTFNSILREIQVLSLSNHKNIKNVLCSFVYESELWIVFPLFIGSCHSMIQTVFKHGFNENVIAVILKNVLQALEYIHNQGQIHRDIKASSILISAYGSVTLSDFGACSLLIENVQRIQHHHTFIGTPCWMAPEQIDTNLGYDSRIDIWAIGITAIELANGQAPHSELPQMNVLTQILKSPPPLLTDNEIDDDEDESDSDSDSESDSIIVEQLKLTIRKITTSIQIKDTSHSNKINEQNNLIQSSIDEEDGLKHSSWIQISKEKQIPPEILSNSTPFSLEFKDFVNQCLQKDPQKRPSASKLLEHKFLKHTKSEDFIIKDILKWIISDHEITKLQHLTKHTYTRPLHILHHSPIQDHTSESPKSLTNSTSNKEGLLSSHQNSAFESIIVSVDGAESQIDNISDVEQMKFKDSRNLWDFEMDNKIQKHIQEQ